MPVTLKLASINIEGSKHLGPVSTFLRAFAPDVVCLQELHESDVPYFADLLKMSYLYAPMGLVRGEESHTPTTRGLGIFSCCPIVESGEAYYVGSRDIAQTNYIGETTSSRLVLHGDIDRHGVRFRIATTHFTWVPKAPEPSEQQKSDFPHLLDALAPLGELVLTGDFNTPRGYELFDALAAKYHDNIPTGTPTTIDGTLHKAGPIPFVVDGFFSSPSYTVSEVVLYDHESDHLAVTGTVAKAPDTGSIDRFKGCG